MTIIRRFGPTDLLMLLLVLTAAGGLRAGYLMACADRARSAGPLRVQDARPVVTTSAPEGARGAPNQTDHDQLIDNVQHKRGFRSAAPFSDGEEATAHVAPGYPYLVGLLARFVPDERLDSTVRWVQVALGTLTAGLYYLFARRAFRSLLVGTLAGLLAAAHPFWIISTAALDDGVLATFALAGCLFLCSQAGEKGGPLTSLLLGLALGATPLVRAALLPFAFVGLVWYLLRSRALPSSWLCGLLAFLGFLTALAPWTVRNYQVFGEPVAVVTSTYYHLWLGNNAPIDERIGGLKQIENQQARYSALGKVVADEVRDRPVSALRRRMYAGVAFFTGLRWLTDGTLAEWTAGEGAEVPGWLERSYPMALQAVLFGMLALAFLGWRWSYGWRWESVPAVLAMIWVPIPYILGHPEGLSGPRLPLDGVLLCYAAFALVGLMPGLNGPLLDPPDAGPRRPLPV